jgi:hypothetical protein
MPQDTLIRRLSIPKRRGWEHLSEPYAQHSEEIAHKAKPDDPSGLTVPVDFGQYITADIADRKDDNASGSCGALIPSPITVSRDLGGLWRAAVSYAASVPGVAVATVGRADNAKSDALADEMPAGVRTSGR